MYERGQRVEFDDGHRRVIGVIEKNMMPNSEVDPLIHVMVGRISFIRLGSELTFLDEGGPPRRQKKR